MTSHAQHIGSDAAHPMHQRALGLYRVAPIGYGAMRLAGPGVFGPPPDRDHAVQLLRQAVEAGVDHIDTAEYYGPHVVNELIRQAQSSAHYAIGPRERVHFVSFGGRAVIELAAVWQQRSSNAAVSAFISSATPQAGTTTSSDT